VKVTKNKTDRVFHLLFPLMNNSVVDALPMGKYILVPKKKNPA